MLKLSEIKEPRFEVQIGDGEVKSFDPWELSGKLEQAGKLDSSIDGQVKAVREATGIEQLTPHACMILVATLGEFVAGLDVTKKLKALNPQN